MTLWNPIPYLNRALYGSYRNHENFDLKPTTLPMTEQEAFNVRANNIPKVEPLELSRRVEALPNAHQVDGFFQVRKIEKGQFEEVQTYWNRVALISPWAATAFMLAVMGGAKVCVNGRSIFLKVAGLVVVIAGSVFAAKCLEDASTSRTNNEILKNIDQFQNYGELFALRRSQLFPQKLKKLLKQESLRLDVDPQRGILHPVEVHALYKRTILEWCAMLCKRQRLLATLERKEQWIINCIEGLSGFFREDIIGIIFRDDPKNQGSLLEARQKLLEMGSKLKEQLARIRIPENKIQRVTSSIQGLGGFFQRGVMGTNFKDKAKKQDDLLEARKKLLDIEKKLKELLAYIQESEKILKGPLQELSTQMNPLMAKVQELQKQTHLDEFVKCYMEKKDQELLGKSGEERKIIEEKWAKLEQEILHYRNLILEAITIEQWGAQLKDYFEASHRYAQYYPEVLHLLGYAQAVIRGEDFSYQLNKKEVTLVVPSPLDPNTLRLVRTQSTLNAVLNSTYFLEVGSAKDYLCFVQAYRAYLKQKHQSSAQNP